MVVVNMWLFSTDDVDFVRVFLVVYEKGRENSDAL
jgi:hypothetical protein